MSRIQLPMMRTCHFDMKKQEYSFSPNAAGVVTILIITFALWRDGIPLIVSLIGKGTQSVLLSIVLYCCSPIIAYRLLGFIIYRVIKSKSDGNQRAKT